MGSGFSILAMLAIRAMSAMSVAVAIGLHPHGFWNSQEGAKWQRTET
jgi:hypothetical protein